MLRCLAVVLLLFRAADVAADTAQTLVGARASGLGGAFTAVADDATAFYWNPAAVARRPFVRGGGFWGRSFEDRGETVDRLRGEQPGESSDLIGDRAWGIATAFTVLGFAASRFTYTRSVLDGTVLRSQGLKTWDLSTTFVQSLPPDDLTIGVNVRYIRGTAFSETVAVAEVPERDVDDLVDRAVGGDGRSESEPGIDLGVLYQPNDWVRMGFSARHLNRPTFHAVSGEAISLEPHARAGFALVFPRDLLMALDIDVTSREHPVALDAWRELAVGAEKAWKEKALSLRGGLRSELSEGGLGRVGFSFGMGIRIRGLSVDVAALTSTRRRLGALWLAVSLER